MAYLSANVFSLNHFKVSGVNTNFNARRSVNDTKAMYKKRYDHFPAKNIWIIAIVLKTL
jgi:hypothetical protein